MHTHALDVAPGASEVKKLYVYTQEEIDTIRRWLEDAKRILDSDSKSKILASESAIDQALKKLLWENDD